VSLASSSSSSSDPPRVLIVSTDPAHSLGDALDEDLRKGGGAPVVMTDPLTGGRLHACEVDASAALDEFRKNLETFDVENLARNLGVSVDLLDSLGLEEFSGLLNNPPPGLDELVALSNVMGPDSVASNYDVVIVDTAPTGHTLRLLALPEFLDGFLGKLIQVRARLSGLAATLQSFFGNDQQAEQRARAIDDAADRLEKFRKKMSSLKATLQNAQKTRFLAVTIPTKLGVAEAERLIQELKSQGITVTDVVVNQCVGELEGQSSEAQTGYYHRRIAGQKRWMGNLQDAVSSVSASEEYLSNGSREPIAVTRVPFFDVELVGIPALNFVGGQSYASNPSFEHLMAPNRDGPSSHPRVIVCGGKGGVGKTTTSSSLAVAMAARGQKVALISTDPAHSLGDALDIDLAGGQMVDCPLIGVPNVGEEEGSLSAIEVDPSKAIGRFKGIIDDLVATGSADEQQGGGGLQKTLRDLSEVFNTLPAGTDEVVALARIVDLVKRGGYDRVVLDTAPTGHTLRMLSTPGFLADLIERVLMISERVNSNAAIKMLVSVSGGGGGVGGEEFESKRQAAESALRSFQLQMYDLEDMFSDPDLTEFLIVTVPTELAVRESIRLLNDLTFEAPETPIKVRNVVVNQVLNDNDDAAVESFLSRLHRGQQSFLGRMQLVDPSITITKVNYLDTEPRGVFGLKALADALMKDEEKEET